MHFDIFISHSTKDKAIADAVCAALERQAFRCWIAPRNIPWGHDWPKEIVAGIKASRAMVLVFSTNSNESEQVHREVYMAFQHHVPVIPLKIENVALSESLQYFMGRVHWLDATSQPIESHLDTLAKAIGGILEEATDKASMGPAVPRDAPHAATATQGTKAFVPSQRFPPAPPVKNLTIRCSSDRTYYVRMATTLELGRQADVSFPLGGFEEARHFSAAQQSSWTRLSRRQLRLSITPAGLALEELRDRSARAERVAYLNGNPWPATADRVLLQPDRESVYEIADVVRWSFHPLRAVEQRGPAIVPELESVVRETGLGGCEVYVQWPGAEATSPHVLLVLWSAVAFTPDRAGDDDLFLSASGDTLWLGSILDAPRLTADSLAVLAGELVPLAPGRKVVRQAAARGGTSEDFTMTCSE